MNQRNFPERKNQRRKDALRRFKIAGPETMDPEVYVKYLERKDEEKKALEKVIRPGSMFDVFTKKNRESRAPRKIFNK